MQDENSEADRWDANDPRRRDDHFAPPTEPCECYCLHCHRTFSSEGIWLQKVIKSPDGFEGYWLCPTNNCGGAGFTFDIFPTDPEHPANAGWHYVDDEESDEVSDEEFEEKEASFDTQNSDASGAMLAPSGGDFIEEGDEWKLGYSPDEPAPQSIYGNEEMREEQARYDAPDERPRIIDDSNRPPRPARNDDDIPF